MELSGAALDTIPDLSRDRGCTLSANKVVDAGFDLGERVLDVAALSETCTEESSIDCNQEPRPTLEQDGRDQKADPEEDLEAGHDRHGHVVVGLDKATNSVGEWVLGVGRLRVGGG